MFDTRVGGEHVAEPDCGSSEEWEVSFHAHHGWSFQWAWSNMRS